MTWQHRIPHPIFRGKGIQPGSPARLLSLLSFDAFFISQLHEWAFFKKRHHRFQA